MTPQDEQFVQRAIVGLADPPPTVVLVTDKSSADDPMAHFCDRLVELAPNIKIRREDDGPFPAPALVMGRHLNIGYQVNPTGKMLEGMVDALNSASSGVCDPPPSHEDLAKRIDLPVTLKLYVAQGCPHCPGSLSRLQALAAHNPFIRLRVIDGEAFALQARADQVRSVPTLILDDQVRWSGPVNMEEVLTFCIDRDPSSLSAASLRQLIEAGDAARVSSMMRESGRLFPALTDLLTHERWSVRLGAMVTAEYLAEDAPALGLELCERLWRKFHTLPPQVQGDVLQVWGQIESKTTRGYLLSVISGDCDEETKATAAEVLDEMGANGD